MYEIREYRREEKKQSPKLKSALKKIIFFIFLLFIVNILINIYFYKFTLANSLMVSPLAKEVVHTTTAFINSRENSTRLESTVQNILKNDNNFAVVIDNLDTGERYYFNENKSFDTASLYKLWVMVVAYQKIEEGELNETDVLSSDVSSLNKKFNISTDSAQLTEGTVSWPVANALEHMITISDNYSALLLAEKIGVSSISNFLEKYNLSESKVGTLDDNPVTTARDVASFLKQLYKGQFAEQEETSKMIDLLKKQTINTKLSKNLPEDVVIAHKTGELDGFSHDAGIVYAPKGNYIIVAMSKTDKPLEADSKIAKISREVYDYFSK